MFQRGQPTALLSNWEGLPRSAEPLEMGPMWCCVQPRGPHFCPRSVERELSRDTLGAGQSQVLSSVLAATGLGTFKPAYITCFLRNHPACSLSSMWVALFFSFSVKACGIQCPEQGLNPGLLYWELKSLSHWTREVLMMRWHFHLREMRTGFLYLLSTVKDSGLWGVSFCLGHETHTCFLDHSMRDIVIVKRNR